MKCDLHLHSNCSDGQFSPEKIVRMARESGLKCIAITDHDTVRGVRRAIAEGKRQNVKVLSGIELSSVWEGAEVHILVYNLDVGAQGIEQRLQEINDMRNTRNQALIAKLAEHGMPVSLESISANIDHTVGRPDIANEMVRLGYCSSTAEAFEKYIGKGKSCYVQTKRLSPQEAILFALRFGGVAVLAHPKNLHMQPSVFEPFVQNLVNNGLCGIESEYFTHNKNERKYYNRIAKEYGLISTGGSDFHDYTHGVPIGQQYFSPNTQTRKVLKI